MDDLAIIIPSYEPDNRLIDLCNNLYNAKINNVFIVNDGSSAKYNYIFKKIKKDFKFTILEHGINLGKGRGLKTAFNYLLVNNPSIIGCVTIDSDGQHTVSDMKKCIDTFLKNPNCLVLGCRNFDSYNVPRKSKFGNNLTCKVFRFFCGLKISDTQTGLRVIPREFMRELLAVPGERFEFETNMLINSKGKYEIKEVQIDTIYDSKENHSTHFKPIIDSIKIYKLLFKVFFKYIISSVMSFIIDVLLFSLFIRIFKGIMPSVYILVSTIIARIFSSLYNYLMNHRFVFNSNENSKKTFIKYYVLVIIQMLISGLSVSFLNKISSFNETIIKMIVDTLLFFVSFFVQRKFIFKNK